MTEPETCTGCYFLDPSGPDDDRTFRCDQLDKPVGADLVRLQKCPRTGRWPEVGPGGKVEPRTVPGALIGPDGKVEVVSVPIGPTIVQNTVEEIERLERWAAESDAWPTDAEIDLWVCEADRCAAPSHESCPKPSDLDRAGLRRFATIAVRESLARPTPDYPCRWASNGCTERVDWEGTQCYGPGGHEDRETVCVGAPKPPPATPGRWR